MPDDLYHRDVLAWSRTQADLLRRVAVCPFALVSLLTAEPDELEATRAGS